MKFIKGIFSWERTLITSLIVILLLSVFNFYGLYTNKFYFFKIGNYVFPLLALGHLLFLYVMWFKIKEDELSDPPMRNLEYILYFISLVYVYKLIETLTTLFSYGQYDNHLIPASFLPVGIFIVLLYVFLLLLTFLTFSYRREIVGTYTFDEMNQHVDNWN